MKQIVANKQITADEIRLIGGDGKQLGVFSRSIALKIAEEHGLDMILISEGSRPVVCKLIELDKYKYDQQKAEKGRRKKSHASILKEIYFRPATGQHDIDTKVNHIKKFISKGFAVKVGIKFRGRERNMTSLGREILENVVIELGEEVTVRQAITQQGNVMAMTLTKS